MGPYLRWAWRICATRAPEQHNPQAAALVTLFRAISNNINNSPMLLDALRKHQCNPDTSCVVDITANMDDEDETESKYANLTPTDEQWLAAAKLCILLKPFQIATDFMQGEEYPTLGGISRYITTLIEGLQGSVPPPHWQLQSSWNSLPDAVKRVRSYILKDMKQSWSSCDVPYTYDCEPTTGAGSYHVGHWYVLTVPSSGSWHIDQTQIIVQQVEDMRQSVEKMEEAPHFVELQSTVSCLPPAGQ
ncbi:hypothetical protein EMCRGX_G019442 [Ephydatia muelleri]